MKFPLRQGCLLSGIRFLSSIRFRLLLWGMAILLLVLVIFNGIVYYRQVEYEKVVLGNKIQAEANYLIQTYREAVYL